MLKVSSKVYSGSQTSRKCCWLLWRAGLGLVLSCSHAASRRSCLSTARTPHELSTLPVCSGNKRDSKTISVYVKMSNTGFDIRSVCKQCCWFLLSCSALIAATPHAPVNRKLVTDRCSSHVIHLPRTCSAARIPPQQQQQQGLPDDRCAD